MNSIKICFHNTFWHSINTDVIQLLDGGVPSRPRRSLSSLRFHIYRRPTSRYKYPVMTLHWTSMTTTNALNQVMWIIYFTLPLLQCAMWIWHSVFQLHLLPCDIKSTKLRYSISRVSFLFPLSYLSFINCMFFGYIAFSRQIMSIPPGVRTFH
jgi:hypothetical protein